MKLVKGTFARLLVLKQWYSELTTHEWVERGEYEHLTVEWIVEVQEADELGLWVIDHTLTGFMEDAHLWIPWHVVYAIATSPELRVSQKIVSKKIIGFLKPSTPSTKVPLQPL